MQTKIRPCRGEFFLKINKRACTSIRYTRAYVNAPNNDNSNRTVGSMGATPLPDFGNQGGEQIMSTTFLLAQPNFRPSYGPVYNCRDINAASV